VNLQQLIDNAQKLPNVPKVVQELIESFGDENINNEQIAKKVGSDQALTAKVLRAANSAYYGGNRKVSSVNDAVFMLGFNAVRTMVLASGITGAFKMPVEFDFIAFWRHSFFVANVSKWLARFSHDDLETAFTCGMIHNIGTLLIHTLLPSEAKEIAKSSVQGAGNNAAHNATIEKKIIGFDFTEAGAELAHRWKFPDDIVNGIKYQLDPINAPDFSRWAAIIYLANQIVRTIEQAKESDLMKEFSPQIVSALDIKLDKVKDKIEETKQLGKNLDAFIS
jgi:HD-like signal output (HDOD) protein